MGSRFQRFVVFTISLFCATSALAADLTVGDLTLVSKQRVGRTTYNFTYKASVTNTGGAVQGASATVTSSSPNTTIIEGGLAFGDVSAGATVASTDTFTIRHNRRFAFDPSALVFDIVSTPLDTTPPALVITSPANGEQRIGEPITVSGTTDDPAASVSVNGVAASMDAATGVFTATNISLVQGQNTITAISTDAAGNTGTSSIQVVLVDFVVDSSVQSDSDEVYTTGKLVRIDVVTPPSGAAIVSGTIQITSASQSYDSGVQDLKFGSIFFQWDTTGLAPANDYVAAITLADSGGAATSNNALTVTLAPNPPAINKLVSEVDISVPAQGFPVNVVRSYLLDSTFDGPMGYGWTHSYRMRAVETITKIPSSGSLTGFVQVQGNVQIFNADGTGSDFISNFDGTYQSPAGDYRTLTKAADGSYLLTGKIGNTFAFDSVGKLTSLSERNGNTQTLGYDSAGRLVTITDASGQITSFTYNSNNRISSIAGPYGRTVTYGYDSAGNLTSVTNNAGFTTTYAYDTNRNLTTVTDPTGKRTFFIADSNDHLTSVAGEGGANSVTFQYGVPATNQMTVTDALGNQTVMTYDNNASVTQIVDPLGNVTQMTYDGSLNLTSLIDAKGGQTGFSYDSKGNLLSTTDAQGSTTILTYDTTFNQVASLTDARGNTTSFGYDAKGNLITTTYPGGASETFTYDSVGNLSSKTDRKGQTIAFAYDSAGRLTQKSFPDSSSDTFTFNAAGNIASATDENGAIQFVYDSLDRLTQVTYPGSEVVSYRYDNANNRTQLVYPNGKTLDYSYDSLNRLTQITEAGQMVASYSYDALSRVTRRDLQNGTFSTYSYDNSNQLLGLINRKSTSEIISSFTYTYDNIGNRLTMTTLAGATQYIYDAINQLTGVVSPDTSTTDYNLDVTGNRTSVTDTAGTTHYSTNNLNQYTSVGTDTYTYDDSGNMTSKITSAGATTYSYDFENRLVQVVTPTDTVTYAYDPFGRRTSKTTSTESTIYTYDGFQVIMEKDAIDAVQATYTYGIGIDEVLVMQRGGVDYFYGQDALGSVVSLTNAGENVIESYSYDVYGVPNSTSSVGNPYYFTGREFEKETSLYFYRARYYSGVLGRFINQDPIGILGGINPYSYVLNNPVNFTDPLGLIIFMPEYSGPEMRPEARKVVNRLYWRLGRDVFFELLGQLKTASYDLPRAGYNNDLDALLDIGLGLLITPYGLAKSILDDLGRFYDEVLEIPIDEPGNSGGNGGDTDGDLDGDGVPDSEDPCPNNPDCDGDGIPDGQDPDPLDPTNPSCNSNPALCAGDPTFVQLPAKAKSSSFNGFFSKLFQSNTGVSSNGLTARLEVPYEHALVRANVPVFGLAYGKNFKQYRVEFGEGTEPAEWITLTTSTDPQSKKVTAEDLNDSLDTTIHGNLATWDTGLKNYVYLPSHPKDHPINFKGAYTIRLVVEGLDGKSIEDRVTVNVGNVIPNAWGGKVRSKDGRFVLTVPEQSIMDSFRVMLAQPINGKQVSLSKDKQLIGKIYEVTEASERFTKKVTLEINYAEEDLAGVNPDNLAIYGFNASNKQWEYLNSFRRRNGHSLYTKLRSLHSHYALLASDNPAEQAQLEPEIAGETPLRKVALQTNVGHSLVRNDFEDNAGQWSNRDGVIGATVSLDTRATFDGSRSLKITNTNFGGNFAVNVVTQSFDVRQYSLVQLDYRIQEGVKTNFLVKVAGRWYEVGFTDDEKELQNKRVNIAHVGDIENVKTDGQWHTAQFNLYDMLRTRTGHTLVEEIIMADWDVGGYMKLQFGHNKKGATYYIDNFSIGRDPASGLQMAEGRVLIDNFNQRKTTNRLGGYIETFADVIPTELEVGFSEQSQGGKGYALTLHYQLEGEGSYSGYMSHLPNIDLRGYQGLSLRLKDDADNQKALIGLRDKAGHEIKIPLDNYLRTNASDGWRLVTIPLVAFGGDLDWAMIDAVTVSFEHRLAASGTLTVDDLAFERNIATFLVDDFEQQTPTNLLGQQHLAYAEGAAAVNGRYTHNSPNGIYSLSYGGNIGAVQVYASGPKSFSGWMSKLGGVDCTRCETLSFRVRGADGGENFTVYLNDGNFEWGFPVTDYDVVTTEWKTVSIPITSFSEYGVDLSHLDAVKLVFEGSRMSGTIYVDDIHLSGELAH